MSDPVSAPTPSAERRWVHDGLFSLSACTPDNPCTADGLLCGWSDELVQLTVVGVEQIPPTLAPSPDPRSPEGGRVDDSAALAAIVGDLWDYPPEESPSTDEYRRHLAERYGADVADVWDRLSDTTGLTVDGDRWALTPATPANRAT